MAGLGNIDQDALRGPDPSGGESSVYQRLRDDILAGRLAADERLNIALLAERYRTSTNPVREALQQLRGEGFVIFEPNRGARVRRIDQNYVREVYQLQELFEPYLTRWFVGQCTQDDITRLEEIEAEIEANNFADAALHNRLDGTFHRVMYDANPNRLAREMWWKHREILRAISIDNGTSLRRRADVIAEHRELIAALKDHDEDRAAEIAARHARGSGNHICDRMSMKRRDG